MGKLLVFPSKNIRHDRPSDRAGVLAASRTINSAVTPACITTRTAKIDCHHSSGMRSRADHLRMLVKGAPVSRSIAECEGHKPMMSRNEAIGGGEDLLRATSATIESCLGQFVLNGKPNLSPDCGERIGQICPMAADTGKSAFKDAFTARVRRARNDSGLTQAGIAELLGIAQDTYKQYETRSYLPHDLIPKFCLATRVTASWLYTGHAEPAARAAEMAPKRPKRQKRRPSKAA